MARRFLCLAFLALAACGSGLDDSTLIWARSTDANTFDPAEVLWGEDAKVTWSLYENLVAFKKDSAELEGRLATGWTFSDHGLTLTFDLRQGVTFHDGTPFDADAVVFTFGRLTKPDHPFRPRAVPYEANFADIKEVRAEGPHRVVFTLKRKTAVILQQLALFGAAIVSPAAVRKHGESFTSNPSGTGPYRLERWDRDVRIVLDRFDGYWGPKPAVARVIVIPSQSPQTAIEKLRRGEVQVVDHPTLADVEKLRKDKTLKVDTETATNVCYLGFNMKKLPYSDPHFRRAVGLALDRDTLNQLVYHGLAEPASNICPPAIWGDTCPTPPYPHDLDRAREELTKAKMTTFDIELIYMTFSRPYMPEPTRVAEFVKDQLRKIGLSVKLTGFDKAAYNEKIKEDGHPMYLLGWNADFADPDNFTFPLLHASNIPELNNSFFDDAAFNDAVLSAQSELDAGKRKALYAKAYGRYRELMPTIPLVHVKQVIALDPRVVYDLHPLEYRFYEASLSPRE